MSKNLIEIIQSDFTLDDITIDENQIPSDCDYNRARNALYSVYRKFYPLLQSGELANAWHGYFIYKIIRASAFKDEKMDALIFTKDDKKMIYPSTRDDLEGMGFVISDYVFAPGKKTQKRPNLNSVAHFTLSYPREDFADLILGLKIFVNAICAGLTKYAEEHAPRKKLDLNLGAKIFYEVDIRVAFDGADFGDKFRRIVAPTIYDIAHDSLSNDLYLEFVEFLGFLKNENFTLSKASSGQWIDFKGEHFGQINFNRDDKRLWIQSYFGPDNLDYLVNKSDSVIRMVMTRLENKCNNCRDGRTGCAQQLGRTVTVAGESHKNVCVQAFNFGFSSYEGSMAIMYENEFLKNGAVPSVEDGIAIDDIKAMLLAQKANVNKEEARK